LIVLNSEASIVSQYLRELRDVKLQHDRTRFENNLERLGVILGYELSKQLDYKDVSTQTPLGKANTPVLKDKIVLSTILRAGLPVQRGVHKILDGADLSFVAAGRKPDTSHGVEIDMAYTVAPDLTGATLVLTDTMMATGKSFVDAYDALVKKHGRPARTFAVCVIASQPGATYVQEHIPGVEVIACAVDPELNDHYYIVPGLGDAGDLLYGPKL
jgi:uracil phosphoribosyltransferase